MEEQACEWSLLENIGYCGIQTYVEDIQAQGDSEICIPQ